MSPIRMGRDALIALLLAATASCAEAQDMHAMHAMHAMPEAVPSAPAAAAGSTADARQLVRFPPALEREVLAGMRVHMEGLAEIQAALAAGHDEAAAHIAALKLGMGSMRGDQAREEAQVMPPGMRALGGRLHMLAGEFSVAAQDAEATGDQATPARLLGQMMQTCVACHAAYRLR